MPGFDLKNGNILFIHSIPNSQYWHVLGGVFAEIVRDKQ